MCILYCIVLYIACTVLNIAYLINIVHTVLYIASTVLHIAYLTNIVHTVLYCVLQRLSGGLLCCAGKAEDVISLSMDMVSTGSIHSPHTSLQDRIYKIEKAFKKFDLNGDGYLSWEEFSQVHSNTVLTQPPRLGSKVDTLLWP